ncbi:MAG: hypothetical protein H7343_11375 [Undibacterium sp.]|nr:hypothetical protein [Opitutaceae bacterium]
MTPPAPSRPWRARLAALVFAATAALLALAATKMMFSAFMFYDDEGYMLISLRNFAAHGGLYREVYSQYGPFPYVLYAAFHALGLPLTHTVGRVITLAAWSGTALACAALAGRATRRLTARLAVLAGVFIYLWIMTSEPTHPGGLIVVVTALLAWLGHRWIAADRPRAWALLVGAGVAMLALTKINIGVFAAAAAVAWFALHHANDALRRRAPLFLAVGIAALPFALMRPLLGTPWVLTYALLFATSGVAAIGAASLGAAARIGWRALGTGVLAALAFTALVLGVIFARGTTPLDLLNGVLLGPLQHPAHFSLVFPWPHGTRAVAFASPVLFAAAWLLRRRGWTGLDPLIAVLRLAATVALAATLTRFPDISPDNLVFAFAAPCLWLFLWPLAGEDPALLAARRWVGLLFLGQCLHAFPVPGSQIAWGTVLAIPLAALGAWPAARLLAARFAPPRPRARAFRFALEIAVAAFAFTTVGRLVQVGDRRADGRDLDLPGIERVRLPENATALFQILALNAAAHGDVLFSEPGMFSLNLWSGLPTPTFVNVTHWFSLLDDTQQRTIIRALGAHPRACIVVQREHLNFLIKRGLRPSGPLHDYLAANFTPAFTLDDFEFSVRRGRTVVPFHLATLYDRAGAGTADPTGLNTLLEFALLLPPDTAVSRVELVDTTMPARAPLVLDDTTARAEFTAINLRGDPLGSARPSVWPLRPRGPTRVSLHFNRQGRGIKTSDALIVLRDAAGATLALVRLRP